MSSEPRLTQHRLAVRITHALAAASFVALTFSGIAILLAHPRLYWGEAGNFGMPSWIDLPIEQSLGHSGWGRSLHFLAGWVMVITGLIYVGFGVATGHLTKHLIPKRPELAPKAIVADLANHLRWRVRKDSSGHYGLLQKVSYLGVVFVGLPVMILTGLTMSPAIGSAYPILFSMFGGRQSARTIHFLVAVSLILFVLIHVAMVVRTGFRRQIRGIILGERLP